MFFSVIIPLYNRPQEIDELLQTLTQQTYTQFEVLVIEDGSVNDARQIVESYVNRLDITYYFKDNEGQGFARNHGFARAKGDYFVSFDSDCLIPHKYFEIVSNYIYEHNLDAYGGPDAAHKSFTTLQKAISYTMTSLFTTGGIRGNKKHAGQFQPRGFNMGISRKVWEKTGGFKLTRLGEDIEYSIRIYSLGFKVGLISDAVVYHKRRTNFRQFYKQSHSFGRGRINSPGQLKLVHFFPSVFAVSLLFTLITNIFNWRIAGLCNLFLAVYLLLIFFHSWIVNKSVKVAFLSIISAVIQLTAYGLGFIQDYWRRIILKRDD